MPKGIEDHASGSYKGFEVIKNSGQLTGMFPWFRKRVERPELEVRDVEYGWQNDVQGVVILYGELGEGGKKVGFIGAFTISEEVAEDVREAVGEVLGDIKVMAEVVGDREFPRKLEVANQLGTLVNYVGFGDPEAVRDAYKRARKVVGAFDTGKVKFEQAVEKVSGIVKAFRGPETGVEKTVADAVSDIVTGILDDRARYLEKQLEELGPLIHMMGRLARMAKERGNFE